MIVAVNKGTTSVLQPSQLSQYCSDTHTYPIFLVSRLTAGSETYMNSLCIWASCCAGKLHSGSKQEPTQTYSGLSPTMLHLTVLTIQQFPGSNTVCIGESRLPLRKLQTLSLVASDSVPCWNALYLALALPPESPQ